MKNKNPKKILSITLTILIVLSISGLSLAYYLARIQGSGKELTSTSGSLSVNYNDEKEIQADNLLPGWTTEKTLTVTNNGEGEVKYNLYWSCIENELERTQDLTYTITENNNEIKTSTFPTEAEEKTIIEQTIGVGEEKTYTVKIEYIRSNEDQSIDMGKIFKGIIDVQAEGTEQKNSCPTKTYTVQIKPEEEVEESTKEVNSGENATFTYTGTLRNPKITCTNNQSGKIEGKIITINKVTNNTTCSISSKHTVQIKVENGTTTETNKEVNTGEETTFTTTPNTGYSNPTVTCTNNQKGTIQNNTVTVSNITNDTTCTVTYKPTTYTITYNLGGGSVTGNPSTYTIETNTITLKNPTKTGYTFTGWTGSNGSTPQTTVAIPKGSTGNKSYTANYKANTYQIKYNSNGGVGTMSNSTHTYGESKALSTNTFTREGYTFQGWSTSSTSNTVKYTNGQNVTNLTSTNGEVINLYAVWKINTYTVKVTVTNGTISGSTSKTVNYNTNATFTVNPSSGYGSPTVTCTNNQKGTIQNNTVTISNITNDTTCTVTYKPITYTITYNLGGGSVTGNPATYTIETNTITLKKPTKTGYTFTGWTGSNGTTAQTTVTIPKGSIGNKTYTANYKINTYKVNVTVLNGTISGSTSKTVNYNTNATFTVNPSTGYSNPTVTCTNSQKGSINGNTLTVSNVKSATTCTVTYIKTLYEFNYTGNYQTFVVPINGKYKFELWGAKGESSSTYSYGSFVSGEIELIKEDKMYVFIGGAKGFNGGGKSTVSNQYSDAGGATDIRLTNGEWNNSNSLRSRIMVAAGSGANSHGGFGAPGGGISGYKGIPSTNPEYTGKDSTGGGATQTSGGEAGYFNYSGSKGTAGSFGQGGIGTSEYSGPGGGGYYGGGGAGINPGGKAAGGSGSSYISGHTGCVAITSASSTTPKSGCTTGTTNNSCSVHYSGKVFTNTVMIDGAGYNWTNVKGSLKQMPNPSGGYYESGKGHIGDGYARITLIE